MPKAKSQSDLLQTKLPQNPKAHNAWYLSAMERLVQTIQMLSQAYDLESITHIVRDAARELTGADGATFALRDGDQCYYAAENSINPLWKGKRFPMSACISGWVMLHKERAVIEDIYTDSRIPHDTYRPTFVKSLVMVPIRKKSPIGAIGNYWATKRKPTAEEVNILQALADSASVALENIALYEDLKRSLETVQEREAKIHAQRDTLEIFTRALAHDLKEPVRTINAFSSLIAQESNLSCKEQNYFQHIHHSSKRVLKVLEMVFLYMQYDAYKKITIEECDMTELVDVALENLQHQIRERKATIIFDALPKVQANRLLVIELLQNVISNAIHFNNNDPKIEIIAVLEKKTWLFKIRDNGIGIDKKNIKKIFLPFTHLTTDGHGTGLGLAICNRIIDSHKGKIWCDSELAQGTTICFTLPAITTSQTTEAETPPPIKESPKNQESSNPLLANILLVDDLQADMELTEIMLNRAHVQCNLLQARSAKEALGLLHQKQQENDSIDLILLDINMPDMDGFEALQHIRADNFLKNIPIIMCSGSSYEKDKERAFTMGAINYVVKPLETEHLEQALAKIPTLQINKTAGGYSIQRTRSIRPIGIENSGF